MSPRDRVLYAVNELNEEHGLSAPSAKKCPEMGHLDTVARILSSLLSMCCVNDVQRLHVVCGGPIIRMSISLVDIDGGWGRTHDVQHSWALSERW